MNDLAAPIAGPRDLELLHALDGHLTQLAADLGAEQRQYAAMIARQTLEQADYPRAFPHLLLSAASLRDPARVEKGVPLSQNLGDFSWCLSPAVCYHSYAELAGRTLAQDVTLTARGRCFRNEDRVDFGTRQIEFEMREIVWIGTEDWVQHQLELGRQRLTTLASHLGLAGEWVVAEDPFFLPAAQGKALLQRIQETKLEYQSIDGVALASVNRHGSFFGDRFGILGPQGEVAHTACLAVGLDRWRARLSKGALL
jgi:hypothetical protein